MITAPPPAPTAPDQLGSLIGDGVASVISGPIDQAMQALWTGCAELLAAAFSLVDKLSTFSVSTSCDPAQPDTCGALQHLWPVLVTLSTLIALGLFFWQITVATVRGGRGMLHAATGTVGYGIALAITVALVTSLLGAADGLTQLLLSQGVKASSSFNEVYHQLPWTQHALNDVKPVILGLVGFFGVLPAALGYAVEMVFRQAAVTVLVATIPFTAAGLLARSTSRWFWISARWTLTAVILKPAFALVLVIGLASLGDSQGLVGLLCGVAVLWVALFSPMALFRLFAFVDPATDSGGAFRDTVGNVSSRFGTPAPAGAGGDGSGAGGSQSGNRDNSGGVNDLEQANTARFDSAAPTSTSRDATPNSDAGMPPPPPDSPPATHGAAGTTNGDEPQPSPPQSEQDTSPDHPSSDQPAARDGEGSDPPPPPHHPGPGNDPPEDGVAGGGGGVRPPGPHPTHPQGGPGGSGATAGEVTEAAETAAVIL